MPKTPYLDLKCKVCFVHMWNTEASTRFQREQSLINSRTSLKSHNLVRNTHKSISTWESLSFQKSNLKKNYCNSLHILKFQDITPAAFNLNHVIFLAKSSTLAVPLTCVLPDWLSGNIFFIVLDAWTNTSCAHNGRKQATSIIFLKIFICGSVSFDGKK